MTLEESFIGTHVNGNMMGKLMDQLWPSLQAGDPFFVPTFLYTYQKFATSKQVLDLLLVR